MNSIQEKLFGFKKLEGFAAKPFIYHRIDERTETVFTYDEILVESRKFCEILINLQIPKNVGIAVNIEEHTPALLIGLLSILNHGCYFSPLIDYGLKNDLESKMHLFGCQFLLSDTELLNERYEIIFVYKFGIELYLYKLSVQKTAVNLHGKSICYAIGTSGSTGPPKVVFVPYSCISVNVEALSFRLKLSTHDIIMMYSPISFDPFVIEFFCALYNGSALIVTSKAFRLSSKLRHLLFSKSSGVHEPTILQMTPSSFHQFLAPYFKQICIELIASLRILLLGGERFPSQEECWWPRNMSNRNIKIYNIYGITEISCWSTIHEWSENDKRVPLGIPIETTTELRIIDEKGKILFGIGKGELQIGSTIRKCLLNESGEFKKDDLISFRNTGDLVERDERDNIFYVGRINNTIKRFGKLICLDSISETLEKILYQFKVRAVCIFNEKSSELIACVELSKRCTLLEQKCRILIMENLKNFEKPDKIKFLNNFPITTHGKIDRIALLRIFESSADTTKMLPVEKFKIFLEETLGLKNCATDANEINTPTEKILHLSFIDAGGTSFNALSLATEIGAGISHVPSEKTFLDLLLNKTVTIKEIFKFLGEASVITTRELQKLPRLYDKVQELKLLWKADLKKCVDASPVYCSREKWICVGSHACFVFTLNALTGKQLGALKLPDRIEGKVKLISNNSALVGCYDGHLYAFDYKRNKIEWSFDVGGMVKSQPTLAEDSVIVASYASDYNLKCIDLKNRILKWHQRIGKKGILVTPILLSDKTAIICTLDGSVARISIADGRTIWLQQLSSPIFSQSAVEFNEKVLFVAAVSGQVHACNASNGKIISTFSIAGNIFSGLSVSILDENMAYVIFGCHDNNVYCIKFSRSDSSYLLHWKSYLQSPVYATPKIFRNNLKSAVCVGSTKGLVIVLDVDTGFIIAMHDLKAEVYSTPCIVDDNTIFIGCRNNYVSCLSLK